MNRGTMLSLVVLLLAIGCQESVGSSDGLTEDSGTEMCVVAQNVRSSYEAGDAEAAAEDARELTDAAIRADTRVQDAQQIRSAMVDWVGRIEWAEEKRQDRGDDSGGAWSGMEPTASKHTEGMERAVEVLDGLVVSFCH